MCRRRRRRTRLRSQRRESVKVIFLDVDGVLNSGKYLEDNPGIFNGRILRNMIDPDACAVLQTILRRTGAKLVISSTWRLTTHHLVMESLLVGRGVESARVLGDTPTGGSCRGDQIAAWLADYAATGYERHEPISSFVILDDDSDMGELRHRLVQTKWALGLQPEHVDKVCEMLDEEV